RGVMPLFGKNVTRTPVHRFYEASHVQDLQRQGNFRNAVFDDVEAPYGARLMALQQAGHTVRLNRSVERAKIELSGSERVAIDLDYIEPGLACAIDHAHLEAAAERP